MTRWHRVLGVLTLAVVLVAGGACSPAETDLELGGSDSAAALSSPPTTSTGSAGLGLSDLDNLGSFPAFLPPVAFGGDIQECQLGTDPYSTCI